MIDAANFTVKRLQCTLLALFVVHIVSIFWMPFYWTGSIVLALVLFLGMIGAAKRHTGILKFYWVVSAIGLVLLLLALLFFLGTVVFISYDVHAHPEQYSAHGDGEKSQIARKASAWLQFVSEHQSQVIVCATVSIVSLFLSTFLKVRSIFLARRLCQQIEQLPYSEDPETAVDSELDKPEQSQPIYVIPQPMFAAPQHQFHYPGVHQLMPVYVDNFGNPIATN